MARKSEELIPKYIKINDDTEEVMKDVLIRVAIDIQCPKDQWM